MPIKLMPEGQDVYLDVALNSDENMLIGGAVWNLKGTPDTTVFMSDLPALYKQDKKGRWQELRFFIELGGDKPAVVRTIETVGLKGKVFHSPVSKVRTKFYSQTVMDKLQSAWNKKSQRDGWVSDKEATVLSEPMLLHHYSDNKGHVVFPAAQSPKLNGIRSTFKVSENALFSRKRNKFSIPHLEEQLGILGVSVDVELWHPSWTLEEISSAVKGEKTVGREELEAHIHDRPQGGTYLVRMASLMKIYQRIAGRIPQVKLVPIVIVQSHEDIEVNHEVMKEMDGTDGSVVRNTGYTYMWDTRSRDILKVKDLIDREYEVVSLETKADALGEMVVFIFRGPEGDFKVVPNWTKERRVEAYSNHVAGTEVFIGATYTISFREYTKNGLPRHVTGIVRRDYE